MRIPPREYMGSMSKGCLANHFFFFFFILQFRVTSRCIQNKTRPSACEFLRSAIISSICSILLFSVMNNIYVNVNCDLKKRGANHLLAFIRGSETSHIDNNSPFSFSRQISTFVRKLPISDSSVLVDGKIFQAFLCRLNKDLDLFRFSFLKSLIRKNVNEVMGVVVTNINDSSFHMLF